MYSDHEKTLRRSNTTLKISLWVLTGFFGIVTIYYMSSLSKAHEEQRLWVPPELQFGATLEKGEIHPWNLYQFAGFFFQQEKIWRENGAVESFKNLERLSAFITPAYRKQLKAQYENDLKRGRLNERTRSAQALPVDWTPSRVQSVSPGTWVVWIDFKVEQSINGVPLDPQTATYPITVKAIDIDRNMNPWGLMIGKPLAQPKSLNQTQE